MIDTGLKRSVINDYLVGGISYRRLAKKYGISKQSVYRWMLEHQQQEAAKATGEAQTAILQQMNEAAADNPTGQPVAGMAEQLKELQKQLAAERLHNKLLTAMIAVAEEELKIPIRKKYGTRRFKK